MYKLRNDHVVITLSSGSIPWLVPVLVQIPGLAKRTLALLLIASTTGCGSSENTSGGGTTPTNPEPTQPSMYAAVAAPPRINLATLSDYVILAGAEINNVPRSRVVGNVGALSTGAIAAGLTCAELEGVIHSSDASDLHACGQSLDMVAVQARLSSVYQEAAAPDQASSTMPGELGGVVLPPGGYTSLDALEISAADLVLDAQGDANAVWKFQVATTLHVAAGRRVILSGGAKAENIYWQVGRSATLGEYSVFKGNILANDSIDLLNGASLEGRAWARQGSVNLSTSTITRPGL